MIAASTSDQLYLFGCVRGYFSSLNRLAAFALLSEVAASQSILDDLPRLCWTMRDESASKPFAISNEEFSNVVQTTYRIER